MASPLTLLMPLNPGTDSTQVGAVLAQAQTQIDEALTCIGTVHYARFLLLDRAAPNLQPGEGTAELVLAVITEYDGDFDRYISDFVAQLGTFFDQVLAFVVGGDAVTPVQQHTTAFTDFIATNNASQQQPNDSFSMYEAYGLTVQQILALS